MKSVQISLRGFVAIAMLSCAPLAGANSVESLSLETFRDTNGRFWEVSVQCEKVPESRYMRRLVDTSQWCSTALPTLCNKDKFSLSRQLCEDSFSDGVAAYNKNVSSPEVVVKGVESAAAPGAAVPAVKTKAELVEEQILIEEQRIQVQQKRLELKQQEIELQKRQLQAKR